MLGLGPGPDLAGFQVLGPGALVGLDAGGERVQHQHPGDVVVQQGQVVGDEQDAAGEVGQEPGQPALGVGVQVVGRLVQQQRGRLAEQHPGQLDPAPLATRQPRQRPVEPAGRDAEAGRDPPGLGLRPVAALGLEPLLEPGEPLDGPVAGAGVGALVDPAPRLLQLVARPVQPAGREQPGQAGRGRGRRRLLGQPGQLPDQGDGRVPSRGGPLADRPQQARLAGPVGADQPDDVAGSDGEARLGDQQAVPDLDGQVHDSEHEGTVLAGGWFPTMIGAWPPNPQPIRARATIPRASPRIC